MFSSHIDLIYINSALQDIFVKLLFIEYSLQEDHFNKYELDLRTEHAVKRYIRIEFHLLAFLLRIASLHYFWVIYYEIFKIVYMHYVMAGLKKPCRLRHAGPN